MAFKIIEHYFLLDGGSVSATVQDDFGKDYELFANHEVNSMGQNNLSVSHQGKSVDEDEFTRVVQGLRDMLDKDIFFSLGSDERAILEKMLATSNASRVTQ